jgi:hypothetical protein
MTTTNEPQDPCQPARADSPGDIPAGRPAALSRLDALFGEWEMEVSFEAGYFGPGGPPVADRGGRARFTWLDGSFLDPALGGRRSHRTERHRDHQPR